MRRSWKAGIVVLLTLLLMLVPVMESAATAQTAGQSQLAFKVFDAIRINRTPKGGAPTGDFSPSINGTGQGPQRAGTEAELTALAVTPTGGLLGKQRFYKLETQTLSDRLAAHVNVASGNLVLEARDAQVRGTGLDLTISRFYNSRSSATGSLGRGWSMAPGRDVGLRWQPDGSVLYTGPSGYQVTFTPNGAGGYTTPTGLDAALTGDSAGGYTLKFHKNEERYLFSGGGMLLEQVDRNNNRLVFRYNGDNTLASIQDTQGRVTTFRYDGRGLITELTDPAGRKNLYAYDAAGKLVRQTDLRNTSFEYDGAGNLARITNENGRDTRFAYDAERRVTRITRILDPASGAGATTSFSYAAADGACPSGTAGKTVVTDPRGYRTTYCADTIGRVTKTIDALNNTTETTYTANSNVARYTDTAGQIAIVNSYDANGNLTSQQLPTGAKQAWQYGDPAHPHAPTSFTDAQGHTLRYAYDPNGNLTGTTNNLASQNGFKYAYNPNGTLASVTDPRGNVTSYGYDAKGNLTTITPPAPLGAIRLENDGLSRLTTRFDGKGQRFVYQYDAFDRPVKVIYHNGSDLTHFFDDDGNLTRVVDAVGGTSAFTYDRLNRQTQKALPTGGTIDYRYDAAGNLTRLTDAGGAVAYAYNPVNLLESLTEPDGARIAFIYDAGYHRKTTAYPNGVTLTQGYDASGRLTSIAGTNAAGATLTRFAYTYTSASGNDTALRQSMTDTAGAKTTYTYDALNRLTRAASPGADYQYAYDGASNRTSQTVNGATTRYTYNAANQLTSAGGTTYGYDPNGNLTSSSAGLALAYSDKDHTTSVTPPGGATLALRYHGDTQAQRTGAGGRTFAHSVLGTQSASDGGRTTHYTRDNRGNLLGQSTPGGKHYFLFDGLGSVVALTDGGGNVVNRYAYDPYGNVTSASGTVANPWRFGGAYGAYTDGTGLVKIGQRYYDPSLGRWTQQDPKVMPYDPVQANRYAYAGCSPVNYTDPSGLDHCTPLGTFGVGLGAMAAAGGAAVAIASGVTLGGALVLVAAVGAGLQWSDCLVN